MDKKIGRPHEGIALRNDEDPDGIAHENDGTTDTEGHGLTNSLPGTGGDSLNPRRPSSGGEFGDEDVEGPELRVR